MGVEISGSAELELPMQTWGLSSNHLCLIKVVVLMQTRSNLCLLQCKNEQI